MGSGQMLGPTRLQGQVIFDGEALFPPIELALEPGSWTVLLGPSGVGKSTLLRLFAGLEIKGCLKGRVENRLPATLMAQDTALMPWLDVRGNILLGSRLRGGSPDLARLEMVLERTGLRDHAAKRPAKLSGGQRQRVALARTLMEGRPLVLLDEPLSALDAKLRTMMQDLAADLLAGATVLLVTHDPAEAARLADHLYLLDGRGLARLDAPDTPVPRPPTAPEVLACQSALLSALLRGDR